MDKIIPDTAFSLFDLTLAHIYPCHPILFWLHFSVFVVLSLLFFVFTYLFLFAQCLVEKMED